MSDDGENIKDDNELVEWARHKVKEHRDNSSEWSDSAIAAYACVAGDQWDDATKSQLEADNRPVFVFNRVAGFIRGICGLETSTRNQVQLYAREVNDSGVTEVLNAAIRYVREGCDADDEESDAFKDMLISGIGFTETLYTTEEDPDGNIIIERVDPLHMAWDPSARKRGLADSRWRARHKWLPISTIEDVWGKAKADELTAEMDTDSDLMEELMGTPHDQTNAHNYDSDQAGETKYKNGVKVTQFQYVKTVKFKQFLNPLTGEVEELEPADYNKFADRMATQGFMLDATDVKHRQYRQLIYAGCVELEDGPLPCQGFTLQAITGIRDRNKGIWYGFVRDLLDPQAWINKFFSSMADVVASQAKGGLLAEVDAFVNKDDAVDDWANPRSIVWLKRDGLGKIKERTSAGVPAGISQLLDFTVESLPNVAGINLEFLGMAGREQPGVLEHQRKQAAISTLAEFFNALRLYRKQQGRVLLQFINEFISDGRLIRVVGKQNSQYVSLARAPDTLKFDIVVDEAPTSPDQKDRTWQALTQILPIAASMGLPVPPEVIQYAPFPQPLIQDWLKAASGDGMTPQTKAKMQQMEQQLQALQKENQSLKTKKEESMTKLQIDSELNQQKMQLEQVKAQSQMELEQVKLQAQMDLERQKLAMQMQLEQEKADTQLMVAEIQTAGGDGGGMAAQGGGQQPRPMGLTEMLRQTHSDTSQAINALAGAMATLANAHSAPKRITDSKGRTFTVDTGGNN